MHVKYTEEADREDTKYWPRVVVTTFCSKFADSFDRLYINNMKIYLCAQFGCFVEYNLIRLLFIYYAFALINHVFIKMFIHMPDSGRALFRIIQLLQANIQMDIAQNCFIRFRENYTFFFVWKK